MRIFFAVQLVLIRRVPSEEYGEKGDKGRPSPDVGQHDGHFFARDFHWVHERLRDGVIAIDADAAQVQNGDGAAIDVEAVPDITHGVAKYPLTEDDDAGVKAHSDQCDQDVGHGQRHDKIVGDDAQFAEAGHANDDEQVAENGGGDDETHQESLDHQCQRQEPIDGGFSVFAQTTAQLRLHYRVTGSVEEQRAVVY